MKSNKKIGKIWKKIAIAGIAVFLIIILVAGFKILEFRSKFSPVTEEQKEKALSAIKENAKIEGYNLTGYKILFSNKIAEIKIEDQRKHVLRVTLENKISSRSYLIDTDDWTILISSQIKYNSWMINKQHGLNIEGRFHNKAER